MAGAGALPGYTRVDVGANDGYFTFGSAAAFLRLAKTGEIFGFEPEAQPRAEAARQHSSPSSARTFDFRSSMPSLDAKCVKA